MLIGAGSAGQMIYGDINNSKGTNDKVVCFIDDNPNKWGRYIDNIPVYGGRDSIMEAVEKFEIDKIYVAKIKGILTKEETLKLTHGVVIDNMQ